MVNGKKKKTNLYVYINFVGRGTLVNIIDAMNVIVFNEISKSSLVGFNQSMFNYLYALINKEEVAELFLQSCFPKPINAGSKYALMPLGALFNLSMLPKVPMGKHEYFSNPMDQVSIYICLYLLIQTCYIQYSILLFEFYFYFVNLKVFATYCLILHL